MKLLLTGTTGFVGKALCYRLLAEKNEIIAPVRTPSLLPVRDHLQSIAITGLQEEIDWGVMLDGVDVIVHLASRVHVMKDASLDPLTEYRKINVDGTLDLARQATNVGVRRFVYISSIKVNGEEAFPDKPFAADDMPTPVGPYAISKFEAEAGLRQLANNSGMEIVIIRPPLVYGPGVKANFLKLLSWLNKGVPLPLGAIYNKRSLVALDNLVDLIVTCIEHPAAANQIFLAGDGEDLSTTELLRRMGKALGRPARLIPVPAGLLKIGAALVGKRDMAQRLLGSLQVDISKARNLLGWTPPVSVDDALKKTAQYYLEHQKK